MSNEGELEYLNLLDEILADRKISSSESKFLFEIAMDYNISQEEAIELHRHYLLKLIGIALIDGIISNLEMKDLIQVANLLNISEQVFYQLVSEANMMGKGTRVFEEKSKLSGKTICFTGTLQSNYNGMPITRELAQKLALEYGLVIRKGVTKDVDFLVTADPDTMSGKAKKARDYNVSVLAEQTFWTMLGIQVS